jgi:hypothetical protein
VRTKRDHWPAAVLNVRVAILAFAMVACACRSDEEAAARAEMDAWAQRIADQKEKVGTVLRTGDPPRQMLSAPLGAGETLDADVVVSSNVTYRDPVGEDPDRTRQKVIHARIRLRAVQPLGERPSIALEVVELSGDLHDLDKLPRGGHIETGTQGDPRICVLREASGDAAAPGLTALQRGLWERDLCGWARRVLMPVPSEPLGIGAAWRRQWTDAMPPDKATESDDYVLTEVANGMATIQGTTVSDSNSADGTAHADASAMVALPLGRRAVPTATWIGEGTATIAAPRHTTQVLITVTTQIHPHSR